MAEENDAQTPQPLKKPRIVRIISDETLEAWEEQRAEYLKQHPEAVMKKQDELMREAIGAAEETPEQTQETLEPKEAPAETLTELTAEEMQEKEEPPAHASTAEAPATTEALEEKEEAKEENEEEPEEETAEEKEEKEEEESRVEVEKPAEPKKNGPVIKSITEPTIKPEQTAPKPKIIEKMNEQASRDIWPSAPQPGTPFNATLEQASKEVRVEEARRLWLQREEQKKKQLGFFGKIKARLGFQ
ncbi:MAG: hypothetical protein V1817_00840 [Candidatus Micrarchaeota archaeon]